MYEIGAKMKIISNNKKAHFNYFVEATLEAGISLLGPEVKSMRQGSCVLEDAFIYISKDLEMFVKNMFVKKFDYATNIHFDEKRDRKLLLHKSEISKMLTKVQEKGYTLVPLKVYFNNGKVKMEVGLCKGKHTYDKKDTLKERDMKRDVDRTLKSYK